MSKSLDKSKVVKEELIPVGIGSTDQFKIRVVKVDSATEFKIQVAKDKLQNLNYRIDLIAVRKDEKEEVLDNGLYTKTEEEANLCLAAMWRGVVYSLAHIKEEEE